MRPLVKQLFLLASSASVCLIFGLLVTDQVIMPIVVRHGKDVEVPDVTEITLEEAKRTLSSRSLALAIEKWEDNTDIPAGKVISQTPQPFSSVKKGRRIYVVLSRGSKLYEVPDVCGTSPRQARLLLEQKGFEVGTITKQPSYEFPKGVVISQIPAPKEMVGKDVLVNLVVSSGPAEVRTLMPNLIGESLEDASAVLEKMGLELKTIIYRSNLDYLPDTVLEQSVEAGEGVEEGQEIDLVVSKL